MRVYSDSDAPLHNGSGSAKCIDCGETIPRDDIALHGEARTNLICDPLRQKQKSPKAVSFGLNSGLTCKHALAVFITRPQADYQIGALHKNNELRWLRQTGHAMAKFIPGIRWKQVRKGLPFI
jgi:hypothetical protein